MELGHYRHQILNREDREERTTRSYEARFVLSSVFWHLRMVGE